jgi:hypothetical protein
LWISLSNIVPYTDAPYIGPSSEPPTEQLTERMELQPIKCCTDAWMDGPGDVQHNIASSASSSMIKQSHTGSSASSSSMIKQSHCSWCSIEYSSISTTLRSLIHCSRSALDDGDDDDDDNDDDDSNMCGRHEGSWILCLITHHHHPCTNKHLESFALIPLAG